MKPAISLLLAVLVWVTAMPKPLDADAARVRMQSSRPEAGGPETDREQTASREEPAQAIARVIGQMKMNLEGSSIRGFLLNIHAAKFEDYPRFEEMIERLLREDVLRVYFRQVSNSIQQDIFPDDSGCGARDNSKGLGRAAGAPPAGGSPSAWSEPAKAGRSSILHPAIFSSPITQMDGRRSGLFLARGAKRDTIKNTLARTLQMRIKVLFFRDAERYRRADGGSHGPGRGRQHRPTL